MYCFLLSFEILTTKLYSMKKLFILLVISLAAFAGCSQEDREAETKNDLSKEDVGYKLNLNDFTPFKTDTIVLFKAYTAKELNSHIKNTLNSFNDELEEIRKKYPNADLVVYKLNFKQNQAFVTDLHFLDTKAKKVIDVFDNKINSTFPSLIGIADLLLGKCPEGWTSGGSFSSKEGIATATEKILSPSLKGSGDCVQIQYARGLVSVQVCHRKC